MTIYNLEILPPMFRIKVEEFIRSNQLDVSALRHGAFPLGFVQNLIERLECAEDESTKLKVLLDIQDSIMNESK